MSNTRRVDHTIIIDTSGSTGIKDCEGNLSRYDTMREYAQYIASVACTYDPDGITVVPFNTNYKVYDNVTDEKVADVFNENSPGGLTYLHPPMQEIFNGFLAKKQAGAIDSLCLIVIFDGCPNDKLAVQNSIINFSNKLSNDADAGILFVQVGYDNGAKNWLETLDNNLTPKPKFDIVDYKTMDQVIQMGVKDAFASAFSD